jgi:hypothetical protein
MELGEFDGRGEYRPAVEGTPDSVASALGTVENHHVVVKLGVAVQ